MTLFWTLCNICAVVGCAALPTNLNGGSPDLPSRTLIILVVVATLLAILSFAAVIAYWNTALFVACRTRPIDTSSARPAGSVPPSRGTDRRRGGPWAVGNRKVSAATSSPSSMGRLPRNTRPTPPQPSRSALPTVKGSQTKLAVPVVGSR